MNLESVKKEKTFVMIKPDGVKRWLIWEILNRFEKRWLKVLDIQMKMPTRKILEQHYPMNDQAWITRLGTKTIGNVEASKLNPVEALWTNNEFELGQKISKNLIDFMLSWPVVIFALEWIDCVKMVRKMVWATLPTTAEVGTIRADYSLDTPLAASLENRVLHNLIHASETPQEAEQELKLRFGETNYYNYDTAMEKIAYNKYY